MPQGANDLFAAASPKVESVKSAPESLIASDHKHNATMLSTAGPTGREMSASSPPQNAASGSSQTRENSSSSGSRRVKNSTTKALRVFGTWTHVWGLVITVVLGGDYIG
jgi:hypothetical protein